MEMKAQELGVIGNGARPPEPSREPKRVKRTAVNILVPVCCVAPCKGTVQARLPLHSTALGAPVRPASSRADLCRCPRLNDCSHDRQPPKSTTDRADPDAFDQSYEIIKKYPEIAVKETTDYLLLVGNDLVRAGVGLAGVFGTRRPTSPACLPASRTQPC